MTLLLLSLDASDPSAVERLFDIVYEELRVLARRHLERERHDHTLQPTALVHEAFVKLVRGPPVSPTDRGHFFGIAARAMRHVLIDHARRQSAAKRGARPKRVTLDASKFGAEGVDLDVLALDEALTRLREADARLAEMIDLRFFAGLTLDETAQAMGLSRRTVAGDWATARAWLRKELMEDGS